MAEQKITNVETETKVPKLADAICEFKKLSITIKKGSDNPFFKSKYADLPTILEAVELELANLGVIVVSRSDLIGEEWVLVTELIHKETLERMVSVFPLFGGKAQDVGSSVTYARRYNIQSLLNLAAEDDDGNAANRGKPIKKATKAAPIMAGNMMALTDTHGTFDFAAALEKVSTIEAYDELKKDTKDAVSALDDVERSKVISKFVAKKQQLTKGA